MQILLPVSDTHRIYLLLYSHGISTRDHELTSEGADEEMNTCPRPAQSLLVYTDRVESPAGLQLRGVPSLVVEIALRHVPLLFFHRRERLRTVAAHQARWSVLPRNTPSVYHHCSCTAQDSSSYSKYGSRER